MPAAYHYKCVTAFAKFWNGGPIMEKTSITKKCENWREGHGLKEQDGSEWSLYGKTKQNG